MRTLVQNKLSHTQSAAEYMELKPYTEALKEALADTKRASKQGVGYLQQPSRYNLDWPRGEFSMEEEEQSY